MIGLLIFGVAAGYVVLWYYVFKAARTRALRIGTVLVAVLIPFWDLPIGYFEFQRYCWTEGGLHVYERISPQDKVYFVSLPSDSVNEMLRQGFKVVEVFRADGKGIVRHELREGKVTSELVTAPESVIAVYITRNEKLSWNVYRYQHVARSLRNNDVVARHTGFTWHGGWLKESISPVFQGRLSCAAPFSDPLTAVLRQGS